MAKTRAQAKTEERKDTKKPKKVTRKKKVAGSQSYLSYYRKLFVGRLNISAQGAKVLDCFMSDIFERICEEASKLCRKSGRKTLTDRDMEFSTKLVLNEIQLTKGAIIHARKALRNFGKDVDVLSVDLSFDSSIRLNSNSTTNEPSSSYVFVSSSSSGRSSSSSSTDYEKFSSNVRLNNRSSPIEASACSSSTSYEGPDSSSSRTFLTPPQE